MFFKLLFIQKELCLNFYIIVLNIIQNRTFKMNENNSSYQQKYSYEYRN